MSRSESVPQRLKRLRVTLQLTWRQLAQLLKLSDSMIYQAVRGSAKLSEKALYRLSNLESEAAIRPENPMVRYAAIESSEPSIVERLPSRIRLVRTKAGLGVTEFAKRCGVEPAYIRAIECGEEKNPGEAFIERVASAFSVSSGWLLLGEGLYAKGLAGRIQDQRTDFTTLQELSYNELCEVLRHFEAEFDRHKGFLRSVYEEFLIRIQSEVLLRARRG